MVVDFIVIGVQKAGTSSLYRYFDAHSRVAMASKSELEFFSADRNYALGLKHYQSFFPARGEVSPAFLRSPDSATRLRSVAPDARLVALLRNPVDRAFSSWKMQVTKGTETLDFPGALAHTSHYLDFGRYGSQLERVLDSFPREQVFVGFFEDLIRRPGDLFVDLCGFLDIPHEEHGLIHENTGGMPRNAGIVKVLNLAFRARARLRTLGLGFLVDNRRIDRGARVLRNRVAAWNRSPEKAPVTVAPETARKIIEELNPEIEIVERLTGRDLSSWRSVQ